MELALLTQNMQHVQTDSNDKELILTHLLGSLLVCQLMFVPGVMALVLIRGGHGHPPGLVHGLGCRGRPTHTPTSCCGTRAVPPSPTHQHHGTPACMARSGPTTALALPKARYPGSCQAQTELLCSTQGAPGYLAGWRNPSLTLSVPDPIISITVTRNHSCSYTQLLPTSSYKIPKSNTTTS